MLGKDLLRLADLSASDLLKLLDEAEHLKRHRRAAAAKALAGRTLAMLFQKPSLRTRVSFETAMLELGGHALYLSPQEVGLGHREGVADVARVLSRYVDAILARTFLHADVELLARYASVPVINGLSDDAHPCQGLADLLTIRERLGGLAGVRLAYVGDGNNVACTLLESAPRLGIEMRIASPARFMPPAALLAQAEQDATEAGTSLLVTTDPHQAVAGADVVYTDTWFSMGQEDQREARLPVFAPYQVNRDLLALARPGAIFMHCLPAHRGEEVTDEVLDGPQSVVYDQAENRLHVQKALLLALLQDRR